MHIQNDSASQKRKIHVAPAQVHDKKVFNSREREIKEHKSVTKWVAAWLINEGFHHDSRAAVGVVYRQTSEDAERQICQAWLSGWMFRRALGRI